MKTRLLIAAIVLALATPLALAQQAEETAPPAVGSEAQSAPQTEQSPAVTDVMRQRLEQMQADMERLSQTQEPAERRKIMQDHRQKMREFGAMMRHMQGGGQGMMMGQGQGMMRGMMGGGRGMMPMMQYMQEMQADMDKLAQTEDPAERQKLVEDYRQKMGEAMVMMHEMHGGGQGMMGPGQGMMGPGQGMMGPGQGMMGPGQGMMGPGQGMMGQGQDTMGPGQGMPMMMRRLQDMQADLDKIAQTEDKAERQKLVEEHRQKMQQAMLMMRQMQGGGGHGMMEGCKGMMGGKRGGMRGGRHMMMGMMEAHRQMDKRLDLMQSVLEHLLEQQEE